MKPDLGYGFWTNCIFSESKRDLNPEQKKSGMWLQFFSQKNETAE
jgi:hypothetical protein